MQTLFSLIFVVALITAVVFFIMTVVNIVRSNTPLVKRWGIFAGSSFAVMIVSFIMFVAVASNSPAHKKADAAEASSSRIASSKSSSKAKAKKLADAKSSSKKKAVSSSKAKAKKIAASKSSKKKAAIAADDKAIKKAGKENERKNYASFLASLKQVPTKTKGTITSAHYDKQTHTLEMTLTDQALAENDAQLKALTRQTWNAGNVLIKQAGPIPRSKKPEQVFVYDSTGNSLGETDAFGGFKYVGNK